MFEFILIGLFSGLNTPMELTRVDTWKECEEARSGLSSLVERGLRDENLIRWRDADLEELKDYIKFSTPKFDLENLSFENLENLSFVLLGIEAFAFQDKYPRFDFMREYIAKITEEDPENLALINHINFLYDKAWDIERQSRIIEAEFTEFSETDFFPAGLTYKCIPTIKDDKK